MTKGGGAGVRPGVGATLQMKLSTFAARTHLSSSFHLRIVLPPQPQPHPTPRHFSLNFNYFHSLARAFLQLINFFTLNFVYNCCWFALFVLFVLLQLVFALLLLLL